MCIRDRSLPCSRRTPTEPPNRPKPYRNSDSFGSAISPLFLEGYSKITLIDLRYVASQLLPEFVTFHENQDVLFLYSTSLLNSGMLLK